MTDAPSPPDFNNALGEDAERMGVALWQLMFPRIEEARAKLEGVYVSVVETLSSLRLDDRYLGAWRGGGLHVGAMNTAVDALMTVQTVLEANTLPMTALYPVLRSAIENASAAIYMLEPKDRDERLRRSFQVANDDAKWRCVFATTMGNDHAWIGHARTKAWILKAAARRPSLGAPRSLNLSLPSYTKVVSLANAAMQADPSTPPNTGMPLLAWWQLLSGMSHGKQWAMIAALERSDPVVNVEDESAQVRTTSSTAVVAIALQRAVETLECALRLYGQRSNEAWSQPEDATEPAPLSMADQRAARVAGAVSDSHSG